MSFVWTDKVKPQFISNEYAECPPHVIIVDEEGHVWTMGLQERMGYTERNLKMEAAGWEFTVLVDGHWTGEWAAKIVRRKGRIAIFGSQGWKRWRPESGTFV